MSRLSPGTSGRFLLTSTQGAVAIPLASVAPVTVTFHRCPCPARSLPGEVAARSIGPVAGLAAEDDTGVISWFEPVTAGNQESAPDRSSHRSGALSASGTTCGTRKPTTPPRWKATRSSSTRCGNCWTRAARSGPRNCASTWRSGDTLTPRAGSTDKAWNPAIGLALPPFRGHGLCGFLRVRGLA